MAARHHGGDGQGRHVRPARRRIRPLLVDADWVVPHFEKMLYDNALLARVYAHWWRRTGDPLARRVARETCAWMIRELRTGEGGLASRAGRRQRRRRRGVLRLDPGRARARCSGPDDGGYAAEVFGVTADGTFEHGRSVLQLPADPGDAGAVRPGPRRAARRPRQRVRPGRDDKVVAAWNGLAIAALAECGLLLRASPGSSTAAPEAARPAHHGAPGGRPAAPDLRDGRGRAGRGVLEDYACLADGLMALAGVTGQGRWVALAGELLETALTRFGDGNGGFYDTADDGERLLYRPGGPGRRAQPVGHVRGRRGAAELRRAHRLGPAPGGGRWRRWRARPDRRPVPARGRGGPRGGRGGAGRAGRDRGRRGGRGPAHRGAAPGGAAHGAARGRARAR